MPDAAYDCQACGACCHGNDHWIPVEAMDNTPESLTVDGDQFYPAFMRMVRGHCVALRKDRGRVRCQCYRDRPSVCREFEPGSEECLEARDKMNRRRDAGKETL